VITAVTRAFYCFTLAVLWKHVTLVTARAFRNQVTPAGVPPLTYNSTMPIHLIGVNHTTAQSSTDGAPQTEDQKHYVAILEKTMRDVRAEYVAEEYSEEAEQLTNRRSLTPKVASQNGAKHRFCDPIQAQRGEIRYLGHQELHVRIWMNDPNWNISNEEAEAKAWALSIGKYFGRRERFWLQQIEDIKDEAVIFVCGDAHVDTFRNLLESEGWKVKIAARGIGITDEDRRRVAAGLRYLQDHPEILAEEWFHETNAEAQEQKPDL
jgi:hypothetical protein